MSINRNYTSSHRLKTNEYLMMIFGRFFHFTFSYKNICWSFLGLFLVFRINLRIFTQTHTERHTHMQTNSQSHTKYECEINFTVQCLSISQTFFVSFLNLSNDFQCEIESLLLVSNRFFIVKSKYRISNCHECIQ